MNYRPYPRYKDSGVEWLGEVPEGWDYLSLRHILSRNDGGVWGEDFDDEGTIVLRSTEMTLDGSWKIDEPARRALSSREQRVAKLIAGDLLVTKSSGSALHLGKTAEVTNNIEDMRCCFSNFMQRLRVNGKAYSRYLYWILNGDCGREQLLFRGTTTTGLANLSAEVINSTIIPLPSTTEQLVIAAFLDRKTAAIDALIKKKQKLIELLQEQRIAIISHAVTKGLNPKAAMKDSGVAWLGEVPEHWIVKPLKFLCEVRGGVTKGRSLGDTETVELPYLRVANVQDGHLNLTDVATIEVSVSEVERYSLKVGDILMNEGGDNDKLGRGALWTGEIEPCLHQNHVFAVRPKSIESEWIALITQSNYAKFYFYQQAKQTTNLASISSTNLKQLPVVLPPEHERQRILEHVDRATFLLDRILDGITAGAEKLKEYRTALISAAVTGKIDVRSATA